MLQIDATVLAGAFIFLTLSSLFGERLPDLRAIGKMLKELEDNTIPKLEAGLNPRAVRSAFDEIKTREIDKVNEVHRFASNYTALSVMVPFAASACLAILTVILQTWFNLQNYLMLLSEISMFIGFITIALVRKIYGVLEEKKRNGLVPEKSKLKKT